MLSNDPLTDPLNPEDLFTCKECGDCCKGYGGTFITDRQLRTIANYIGMDPLRFIQEKCQISDGKPVLAQKENGYCIFWDGLCTIYSVRPDMCRKWPFIESVLHDVSNWHIMAGSCPGMRTDIPSRVILDCVKKKLREFEFSDSNKHHPIPIKPLSLVKL